MNRHDCCSQGYIDAARAFQQESGVPAGPSDETADVRMRVRQAVEQGNVDVAIEEVNDLNPEVPPHAHPVSVRMPHAHYSLPQ